MFLMNHVPNFTHCDSKTKHDNRVLVLCQCSLCAIRYNSKRY